MDDIRTPRQPEGKNPTWTYDRRCLRASLILAAVLWGELLLFLWLATASHLPYFTAMSPEDRFGLKIVAFGWPAVYGLALGMVYLAAVWNQGAVESGMGGQLTKPLQPLARLGFNAMIILFPLAGAVITAVALIGAITGLLKPGQSLGG